jgi:transcriptional regulator with XRE-family HTH domain
MSDGVDPMDVALGHAVRDLRRRRGLSQTELGDRLGVGFQLVRAYERGAQPLSLAALSRIAKTLECRSSDLVSAVEDGGRPRAAVAAGFDDEALELLRLFSSIRSKEMRQALLQVAKAAARPRLLSDRSE